MVAYTVAAIFRTGTTPSLQWSEGLLIDTSVLLWMACRGCEGGRDMSLTTHKFYSLVEDSECNWVEMQRSWCSATSGTDSAVRLFDTSGLI